MTSKSARTCHSHTVMATMGMAERFCGGCKSKAKWMQNTAVVS